jgi:FkbM family methyltransferase
MFDNIVIENAIKNIGMIKVDIEGHEKQFLYGAKETIKKI